MTFTKTSHSVEYHVHIAKKVPSWVIDNAKDAFVATGKIDSINSLRKGFFDVYGENMTLADATGIIDDMIKTFNLSHSVSAYVQMRDL